jgi:transcriptional regulator with XRE-family HTH domain
VHLDYTQQMSSQGIHSEAVETPTRKLRTFLSELMESAGEASKRPAICQRIHDTRDRLRKQWNADHPGERGNPFTQEAVARRVGPDGVTLGAYGAWERTREPELYRLRQIATALGLDEDYFAPSGDLASATARVEAEADRLARQNDQIEELLAALRSQLAGESADRPLAEPDR